MKKLTLVPAPAPQPPAAPAPVPAPRPAIADACSFLARCRMQMKPGDRNVADDIVARLKTLE